ncbi:MAG: hypothetical protein WD928_04095 [Gammaproteobacteria bacterium]
MLRLLCVSIALSCWLTSTALAASDAGSAARQAAQMTGGRVLDVQTGNAGERMIFLVRVLLPDGRVKIVRIDGPARRQGSP